MNAVTKAELIAGVVALVGVIWIFERLRSDVKDAADTITAPVKTVAKAVNPLNQDNIFSQGADKLTQIATGDRSTSLGSWVYDLFHDDYDPNAPQRVGSLQLRR